MKKKLKPVMTYLCYLLILSMLMTGVTFSRFLTSGGGGTATPLSRFACSYEISDISSLAHSNSDFWLTLDTGKTAMNTARTVRFLMRNYETDENGMTKRISDLDLQSSIRLYMPFDYAANLALQVEQVTETGTQVITPQYVLGNLIYRVAPENEVYQYVDGNGMALGRDEEKVFAEETRTLETKMSPDYQARTEAGREIDETLTVTGGFSGDAEGFSGSIQAVSDTGSRLTLTGTSRMTRYAVGFKRGTLISSGEISFVNGDQSALFIDCQEQMPYCTVDLSLPQMVLPGNRESEKTFVLYITLVERLEILPAELLTNSGLTQAQWETILTPPMPGEPLKKLGDAEIVGWHFAVGNVPTYVSLPATGDPTGSTKIQVQWIYDYQGGGGSLALHHVAPLREETIEQVHPILTFYSGSGNASSNPPETMEEVQLLFGVCSNGKSDFISLSQISGSPYYETHEAHLAGGERDYELGEVLSKSYYSQMNVLFVQASESQYGGRP